jgi:nitroimidazol reductase NimA-like FMN-containing flavoprotein (pyridoxamine 5'-phosphate oxidase superfamily)
MLIREMTGEECLRLLARARLARLACAHDNQPYVVPIYFAYDEGLRSLCAFTFPGRKVEWMRANPQICVQVDEIIAGDQWMSVVGIGRYEELPQSAESDAPRPRFSERTPESRDGQGNGEERCPDERERAWQLLKTIYPVWGEPACTAWAARVHRDATEPIIPIYFRIRLDHITGHQAIPNAGDAISHAVPATVAGRWARLLGTLIRVLGRK